MYYYDPVNTINFLSYQNFQLSSDNIRSQDIIKNLQNQLKNHTECYEYLQEDSLHNQLYLVSRNLETQQMVRFSLFIIKKIIVIVFKGVKKRKPNYVITIRLPDNQEELLIMEENELQPNRLPGLFRPLKSAFVSKRSDTRKGELLADYISHKLKEAEVIELPDEAGWFYANETFQFMDGFHPLYSLVDNAKLQIPVMQKKLLKSCESNPRTIIQCYFNRGAILKSTLSVPLVLFFHASLLLPILEAANVWTINKFLYIQVSDGGIGSEQISQAYLQSFNNDKKRFATLDAPLKQVTNNMLENPNEMLVLKLDTQTQTHYGQQLRLSNWNIVKSACIDNVPLSTEYANEAAKVLLTCISNHNISDLPLEDALSIYIRKEDVVVAELNHALNNPQEVGDYIYLLTQYISNNCDITKQLFTEAFQRHLPTGIDTFDESGTVYAVFMTIFEFIEKFLNHYNIKIDNVFYSADELKFILHEFFLQNEVSSDNDTIVELFISTLSQLIPKYQLVNRKTGNVCNAGDASNIIYCDESFIYVREQFLRDILIKEGFPFYINVNQLLKALSTAGIIESDNSQQRTYLKTVYLPFVKEKKHQEKLVAVHRNTIWELGEDIYHG